MNPMTMTVAELKANGGVLPPGWTLRGDDDELASRRPPSPPPTAPTKPKAKGKPTGKPKPANKGGRWAVFNAFVDAGMISLSEAELKVWLILFRDVKAATGTAQTGRGDMAKRAGMKPDTIRKAMKKLKRAGRVKLLRTGRPGGGPSVYSVHPTGS